MNKVSKRLRPAPSLPAARRGIPRRSVAVVGTVLGLALLAGTVWGLWHMLRPMPRATRVVLISVDTLRADRLPAYGYTAGRTPAIDSLAADGIVFERAYAHSPQTLPSHASILTGRLPFETGVRDNTGFTLGSDHPTLASLLKPQGFETGGVVSAFVMRRETGLSRGFDFYDSDLPPSPPDTPMGEVQRGGEDSLSVARRWLEGGADRRYFLFFHVYEPHAPYTPPPRFARGTPYDGEVAHADEIVGQLISLLKARGEYEDALIVFLADHGEGLGDHGEEEHGLFLYDETIRVPLIIKMPGQEGAGRRVMQPVQHIDLVPTFLDLVGAPIPEGLRGRSLRPVLTSKTAMLPAPGFYAEAFYSRFHFGWSELLSLTDERYRYIKAPRPELYDLVADPRQQRNIVRERASATSAMRAGLDLLAKGGTAPSPGRVSAEDLARLQSLGYVGSQPAAADAPGDTLPDPKDKVGVVNEMRLAAALAGRREYERAISTLQALVARDPGVKDAWLQLGVLLGRAGRYEECLAAFKRLVEVDPTDANSYISVAGVLLSLDRLEEARAHAAFGLDKASPSDSRARTAACEVLVRVALGRADAAEARRYAAMAQQADARFPLPAYVEGRLLHGQKRFEEALAQFDQATRTAAGHAFVIPELRYYAGDALANLGRPDEAVRAFRDELRVSPGHLRTRASLAMLYQANGQPEEAAREIQGMLDAVPTPEGYEMATKTWSVFGLPARANAVRAEASRRFSPTTTGPRR
jgi:tetratricopeptide (TPR) repeat protein